MTFTDDDLKLYKETAETTFSFEVRSDYFLALLARLEAAERVITMPSHECVNPDSVGDDDRCLFCSLRNAWCKAKGE